MASEPLHKSHIRYGYPHPSLCCIDDKIIIAKPSFLSSSFAKKLIGVASLAGSYLCWFPPFKVKVVGIPITPEVKSPGYHHDVDDDPWSERVIAGHRPAPRCPDARAVSSGWSGVISIIGGLALLVTGIKYFTSVSTQDPNYIVRMRDKLLSASVSSKNYKGKTQLPDCWITLLRSHASPFPFLTPLEIRTNTITVAAESAAPVESVPQALEFLMQIMPRTLALQSRVIDEHELKTVTTLVAEWRLRDSSYRKERDAILLEKEHAIRKIEIHRRKLEKEELNK